MNRPWGVHGIGNMIGASDVASSADGKTWYRAVPEPYGGNRLVAAWWVLTGRAEAVVWPQDGELERALK